MEVNIKRPLRKEELVTLFDTGNIPQFLSNKYNYISGDLRDFYIGMTRKKEIYTDGNPRYTYIIKKVVIQSNYIKLPYRRGSKVIRNWQLGNYMVNNAPIVIILDVTEYKFSLDGNQPINYNLIGIFELNQFKDLLIQANNSLNNLTEPFEDFSPLSGVGTSMYNLELDKFIANIRKNKSGTDHAKFEREDGRISITKEEVDENIIGQNYDIDTNLDGMINNYINSEPEEDKSIEELNAKSAIQENINENKRIENELSRKKIEDLLVKEDIEEDNEDIEEKTIDFSEYINKSDEEDDMDGINEEKLETYDGLEEINSEDEDTLGEDNLEEIEKDIKLQDDSEYFGIEL